MMKKFLPLAIAAVCLFMFSGCGKTAGYVRVYEDVPDAEPENYTEPDVRPAVMIDGELYCSDGRESEITGRCGVMDGEITSSVGENELPSRNGESNFGSGFGYQVISSDTLEVNIDGKWIVFELQK